MKSLIDFLKMLPTPVQIAIAALILGAAATYAHETRYMTVSDFTKSYVLDLKRLIRELEHDLDDPNLTDREREMLEDEIADLIDELCYEVPSDRLCREYE